MRVRVPGGLIEADQLGAIAELAAEFADGTIEITSRANLQLRAIQERDLEKMIGGIVSAGLLPSPRHDRVRNIVTSPVAGLDAGENIDTRPLVRELDRRLSADSVLAELHPKFSFGLYGGRRRFSHDVDDLSLDALDGDANPLLGFSIGGAASGFTVTVDNAVDCLLEAARVCIALAREAGVPVRGKGVIAIPGAMGHLIDALSHYLVRCAASLPSSSLAEALLGVYRTIQADRVSVIPLAPLGRLSAEQARCLADIAKEREGDLRLAPWRGVVLGSVPSAAADDIVGRLESVGLSCDGRNGLRGIAACAGITGCDASLADVRSDAALLAERLSDKDAPRGWTVNLSGCDKQCARRHGATAELIADASGYTLKIKGQLVASGCAAEFAIDAVAALHTEMLSEGGSR